MSIAETSCCFNFADFKILDHFLWKTVVSHLKRWMKNKPLLTGKDFPTWNLIRKGMPPQGSYNTELKGKMSPGGSI